MMLAAVLLLLPLLSTSCRRPDLDEIYTRTRRGVVTVTATLGAGEDGKVKRRFGSGFVTGDGKLIVTSAHNVIDAARISVSSWIGEECQAEIRGVDRTSDVAVLEASLREVVALPWAREGVRVGQTVAAVGNPYGIGTSLLRGLVSARGRRRRFGQEAKVMPVIQTDLPSVPGLSGAPLLDLEGEVVGMISARTEGEARIGFAMEGWILQEVTRRLTRDGRVVYSWLGAVVRDIKPDLAIKLGLVGRCVAMVERVVDASPASASGLEPGDVIVELDGRTVRGEAWLRWRLALTPPGTGVDLELVRGGEDLELRVVLEQRKD